jgi:carnitine 3-dehydrogenase
MKRLNTDKVTLYGTGLIGAGWATQLLLKGLKNITMFDISEEGLSNGNKILNRNLDFLISEKVITETEKTQFLDDVKFTSDVETAVADADIIIENGPEIVSVKQDIIAAVEDKCRGDAIITSSTSGILISDIIHNAKHPERILGAHPYHPVYLLPLLEIVKSEKTGAEYLEAALEFFRSVGKKPVVLQKESDGYIGSRLMTTLLRESVSMITNGVCTMQDIDDAFLYGPGMRYALFGIFATLQLGGGEGGLKGMLCGPIGSSTNKWIGSFCNWDHWPQEALDFFDNSQTEMNKMLAKRDCLHGRDNKELESFRDKGLVEILKIHGMI